MTTKDLSLVICEMFRKDYSKKPILQTMLDVEVLINKYRPEKLILPDVIAPFYCNNDDESVRCKEQCLDCDGFEVQN